MSTLNKKKASKSQGPFIPPKVDLFHERIYSELHRKAIIGSGKIIKYL